MTGEAGLSIITCKVLVSCGWSAPVLNAGGVLLCSFTKIVAIVLLGRNILTGISFSVRCLEG
jgi:hypothetical protein